MGKVVEMVSRVLDKVTTPKKLQWFANNTDRIRYDLDVQRNYVWTELQASMLVHSFLAKYPVYPVITCSFEGDDFYWVLDGQQRLTSIQMYINGEFALHEETPNFGGIKIAGLYFSELPNEVASALANTQYVVFHYKNVTEEDVQEIFKRLNMGTPLTKTEINRVRSGRLRKDLNEISNRPLFNELLNVTEKSKVNFSHAESVLQVLTLLENESFDGLSQVELAKTATKYSETGLSVELRQELDAVFEYVEQSAEGFLQKEKKMFKKSVLPAIVAVASRVMDSMSAKEFGELLKEFFVETFELRVEFRETMSKGTTSKRNVLNRVSLLEEFMVDAA